LHSCPGATTVEQHSLSMHSVLAPAYPPSTHALCPASQSALQAV
jgi:hypothetical protein